MNDVRDGNNQEQMIQTIIERGIRDERVLAAIRSVPREFFFPREARQSAYADKPSPIGHGQTISQPYMAALMTERLRLEAGHTVLEVGSGTGYQTAILAKLAREVFTVERVKPLLDEAFERLLSLNVRNVHYRFGDGTLGWPEAAPFDRILITAGAPAVPSALLLSQLADGGIAVLPAGGLEAQMLMEVRRHGDRLETHEICPCRFVKLIGQEGWADKERA